MKAYIALAVVGFILLGVSFLLWPAPAENPVVTEAANEIDMVARGKALFIAKGCAACHQHDEALIFEEPPPIGPNLTDYWGTPDLLGRLLSNPSSIRPETNMPNLELDAAEIEALVTFLIAE